MGTDDLVTLILFSYNQERFIREAVQSALAQSYCPLEIIISDDCSTDATFSILQEEIAAYHGPARIVLNRNKRNLGSSGNFNHALQMSRGGFIVGLGGDDIAYPERVSTLHREWKSAVHPVELVCSYYEEIDADGAPTGYVGVETYLPDLSLPAIKWKCAATGAACGFSRRLFEKYGPVRTSVIAEDWVYPFRAWVEAGDILVIREPLIKRRVHEKSLYAVSQKNRINRLSTDTARRAMRLKNAQSELGIAEEWLLAWEVGGKRSDAWISSQLQNLVMAKSLYVSMFEANPLRATQLIAKYYKCTGDLMYCFKCFARFVLGWE